MTPQQRMIEEQIRGRDVRDPRVLEALGRVPRDRFVPESARHDAYADHPVPIGHGQTISQPYIVAFMTEALRLQPSHRVLEIGTGCGYQTAVLADLVREVYSVEVIAALAEEAGRRLEMLGYGNVRRHVGDGHHGWPEHAPYDRILVAAAADAVPPPLVEQLVDTGILVIPVGASNQELRVLQKHGTRVDLLATLSVRFVPLVRP
ncbi:MAG TPA: protein-L-isoaspartate(D-aspartate) O-methyltransferase [Vicinamibacterales bacterium]|jgi:protein-L-isoaspartate(D-aspartate) O-methyltransferase